MGEFHKKYEAERAERERLGLNANPIWKTSYVAPANEDDPVHIRLFGIGCHLGELIEDLRGDNGPQVQSLIEQLNREFGNVREVAGAEDASLAHSMIQPVSERFRETLALIETARPELAAKCQALGEEIWLLGGGEEAPF